MSKAELEVLAEKYEAKAQRNYQNYQETGITRYDRERRNAEELASAMRMAARASDDYSQLINLRGSISMLASKAKDAMRQPEEKKMEAMREALRNLVSMARLSGLTSDDEME